MNMEEITIQDTEIVEESTEIIEVSVDELMEVESGETVATTVAYDDTVLIEMLTEVRGDMRILVLFAILTFCSSCLRAWRNTVIKGVR